MITGWRENIEGIQEIEGGYYLSILSYNIVYICEFLKNKEKINKITHGICNVALPCHDGVNIALFGQDGR